MRRLIIASVLLAASCSWYPPASPTASPSPPPPIHTNANAIIRSQFEKTNVCQLGRGIYLLEDTLLLTSGQRLLGAGMNQTILRLIDNSPKYAQSRPGRKFELICTETRVVEDCKVSHLTLDGNMQRQTVRSNTMVGLWLYGAGHSIDSVRVIGCGYGSYAGRYQESFLIGIQDLYARPTRWYTNRIENCVVEGPALGYRDGGQGDITCIVMQSAHGRPGLIRGCVVRNMVPTVSNKLSNIHAFAPYGNTFMTGNLVSNVYGTGVYMDTWTNVGPRIEGNVFHRTWRGVWLSGVAATRFHNLTIARNTWRNWDGPLGAVHVNYMVAERLTPSFLVLGNGSTNTFRLEGLRVENNLITLLPFENRGRVTVPSPKTAIWCHPESNRGRRWTGIVTRNNLLR